MSAKVTHGLSGSRTYRSWQSAIQRCHNPNHPEFFRYGARGIAVCDEWRSPGGFERFLAALGERPEGRTLDRIDNAHGYLPGNCTWSTPKEQARNRSRHGEPMLEVHGERITLDEAAAALGVSRQSISSRLAYGWTHEEAATIPKGGRPDRPTVRVGPPRARRRHVAHSAPSEAAA